MFDFEISTRNITMSDEFGVLHQLTDTIAELGNITVQFLDTTLDVNTVIITVREDWEDSDLPF